VRPNGRHRAQRYVSVLSALVWFAISYGVAIGGYLLLNASASRLLSPALFGYFVVAMTAATVVGQLGLMGVHRAGLREAARLAEGDDEGLLLLRRGVRAVLVLALPLAGFVSGAVAFALADDYDTSTRWLVGIGMALMVVLGGQQKLWANYLRGFGDIKFASLLEGRSGGALVAALQAIGLLALLQWWPDAGIGVALRPGASPGVGAMCGRAATSSPTSVSCCAGTGGSRPTRSPPTSTPPSRSGSPGSCCRAWTPLSTAPLSGSRCSWPSR
jgi:hypothetical protein